MSVAAARVQASCEGLLLEPPPGVVPEHDVLGPFPQLGPRPPLVGPLESHQPGPASTTATAFATAFASATTPPPALRRCWGRRELEVAHCGHVLPQLLLEGDSRDEASVNRHHRLGLEERERQRERQLAQPLLRRVVLSFSGYESGSDLGGGARSSSDNPFAQPSPVDGTSTGKERLHA